MISFDKIALFGVFKAGSKVKNFFISVFSVVIFFFYCNDFYFHTLGNTPIFIYFCPELIDKKEIR